MTIHRSGALFNRIGLQPEAKLALIAFAVGMLGACVGVVGSLVFGSRLLHIIGLLIVVPAVLVGAIFIIAGMTRLTIKKVKNVPNTNDDEK